MILHNRILGVILVATLLASTHGLASGRESILVTPKQPRGFLLSIETAPEHPRAFLASIVSTNAVLNGWRPSLAVHDKKELVVLAPLKNRYCYRPEEGEPRMALMDTPWCVRGYTGAFTWHRHVSRALPSRMLVLKV